MVVKSFTVDRFGPYTETGTSLNGRFPQLPPGEKVVIVAASTKAGVAHDEVISLLSGTMDDVVATIGSVAEAPDAFYAARAFIACGGRYMDFVLPTSAGAHLTEDEAVTQAAQDAVEASDASLIVVPKPTTWIADGYGHYLSVEVDQTYIDLAERSRNGRQFYLLSIPQDVEGDADPLTDSIDYVTNVTYGINRQSKQAAVYLPSATVPAVGGGTSSIDITSSVAGLAAKLAREHARGVAKAPAGSAEQYQLAGLSHLNMDLYPLSDTAIASLQNALINPVFSHNGIYVFGASTLERDAEDTFRHLNISRMHSEIRQQVSLIADDFIFENTDDFTLKQLKLKVDAYMKTLVDNLKVKDFFSTVAINGTNQSQVDVTLGWKPQFPIEFIVFTVTADVE